MRPFTFWNPTKIIFGGGTIPQVGEEVRRFGNRVLLVYGQGSVKRIGVYDRVVESLQAAGLEIVEFPGVKPNPILSHARQGIALAKQERVEAIAAVGGGSVIDESKAIAAGAVTDADVWDFYTGKKVEQALPVVTVLTLPATGTEMNGGTVLTNEETREKIGTTHQPLFPKTSILDPTVTYTIPRDYTAYAAVDSMSHLMEGYFTSSDPWTPIQDRYVEGLVRTIMETAERILADPSDEQGRATMMWAATLAWNRLSAAGVGPTDLPSHMLEHPLSAMYDIAHGAGLAIVMPAWMTFQSRQAPAKIAQFARNVLGADEPDDAAAAERGIALLRAWFDKVGAPTSLSAVNIPLGDIPKIADRTLALAKVWGITRYTREMIEEMYGICGQWGQ